MGGSLGESHLLQYLRITSTDFMPSKAAGDATKHEPPNTADFDGVPEMAGLRLEAPWPHGTSFLILCWVFLRV